MSGLARHAGVAAAVLVAGWLGGCGGYAQPSPTTRAVQPADLAGAWAFHDARGERVIVNLRADGTCDYAVAGATPVAGRWSIAATADLSFDGFDALLGGWVIDDPSASAGVGVYGGFDDPDVYQVWRRVKP